MPTQWARTAAGTKGGTGETIQFACYAYVAGGLAAPCPPDQTTPGTPAPGIRTQRCA